MLFFAYSCDGLGVRPLMEPFISSPALHFIGLGGVHGFLSVNFFNKSKWVMFLMSPQYMGLPCSSLYSFNSVGSNHFTP